MFYLIFLCGVLIFCFLCWREVKFRSLHKKRQTQSQWRVYLSEKMANFSVSYHIISRFLTGGRPFTLKGASRGIICIICLVVLFGFNENWLQFNSLVFALCVLVVGLMVVRALAKKSQKKAFEQGFAEALATITASVMAGSSLHQALRRCGETIIGDVGDEFSRVTRRLDVGEDPDHIFLDAWRRFRYNEFYYFIMILMVSMQRGGQLKTLIGRLSRVLMDTNAMEKKKNALTSEARASVKIVGSIPIIFLIGMKYLWPDNFDFIVNDPIGNYVLYYVIGSETLGLLIVWFLIKRAT